MALNNSWSSGGLFTNRNKPLSGKTVAITRPKEQASELAKLIRAYGGRPYIMPTIRIKPLKGGIDSFLKRLAKGDVDYTIFMSANSIRLLIGRASESGVVGHLMEMLSKTHVVTVGPKTSNGLQMYGVKVDIVPQNYTSQGVVEALKAENLNRKRILIPRAKGATPYLSRKLGKLGARVEEFFIYRPSPPSDALRITKFAYDLARGVIDAIIFTSSSTVTNLFKIMKDQILSQDLKRLLNDRLDVVAIGPVTARTLKELGVAPKVVPKRFLVEDTVSSLAGYYAKTR